MVVGIFMWIAIAQCSVTVSSTANVYSCVVLPVNIVERDGAINSI